MQKQADSFATRVVQWQKEHGRNELPWQNTQDPYRVWLSEIMLQQTQVATVKAYFRKFVTQFPDVSALAGASQDAVFGLWSGLGYYTRARNLHLCAQRVMAEHGGCFPQDARTLATLPGIGPSTAAAISSLCFGERVAILDANVKRVVTRVSAFAGDLALSKNEKELWRLAGGLLPAEPVSPDAMRRYTQGMMDLGALVCSPKNPACGICPVAGDCRAHQLGMPEKFPVKNRKLKRSSSSLWLLWLQNEHGQVLLTKRPSPGVWGGLYCLPLFDSEQQLLAGLAEVQRGPMEHLAAFTHVLTHKDLHLHPVRLKVHVATSHPLPWQNGAAEMCWADSSRWQTLGLPAPVRKLLDGN